MELNKCKIGVPFNFEGRKIVARLSKIVRGSNICASCVLYNNERTSQCKYIKECTAFNRKDGKSVIFKLYKIKNDK